GCGVAARRGTAGAGGWSEGPLAEGRHALLDGGQDGGRIERARTRWDAAAEPQRRPATHRFLHLAVKRVAKIVPCERADLGVGAERITHAARRHLGHETLDESLGDRLDDD